MKIAKSYFVNKNLLPPVSKLPDDTKTCKLVRSNSDKPRENYLYSFVQMRDYMRDQRREN